MAKRIVVWTEIASKQRREVLKYWTKRNGSTKYAEKLIGIAKHHINILSENPTAFKMTNFADTRISAMGHFSILYKITVDKLIVTAFWDNRQDPKKLFKLLSDQDRT